MFNNALVFGGGVAVILLGVRTILGEIVPAFAGIAERVIPGAVPALDCPVAFPYAPNAVLIGFLASVAGGLVGFGILWAGLGAAFAIPLILPGMIPHFSPAGRLACSGTPPVVAACGWWRLRQRPPDHALRGLPGAGDERDRFQNTTFGDDFQWFGFLSATWPGSREDGGHGIIVIRVVPLATPAGGRSTRQHRLGTRRRFSPDSEPPRAGDYGGAV
jgi:PTS system ascorbate-specific IIC component